MRGWRTSTPRKEIRRKGEAKELSKGKGSRHRGGKPPTPSREIDAIIGDKEQNEKRKKEIKIKRK